MDTILLFRSLSGSYEKEGESTGVKTLNTKTKQLGLMFFVAKLNLINN